MKEKDLVKKIIVALHKRYGHGIWILKTHGGPQQQSGVPDLLICLDGIFIGIEVKMPGRENKVTDLQAETMKRIKEACGFAEMTSSVEGAFDIIDKALKEDSYR